MNSYKRGVNIRLGKLHWSSVEQVHSFADFSTCSIICNHIDAWKPGETRITKAVGELKKLTNNYMEKYKNLVRKINPRR